MYVRGDGEIRILVGAGMQGVRERRGLNFARDQGQNGSEDPGGGDWLAPVLYVVPGAEWRERAWRFERHWTGWNGDGDAHHSGTDDDQRRGAEDAGTTGIGRGQARDAGGAPEKDRCV